MVLGRDVRGQYWYALGKELLISNSRHSLTCTIQPWISILWQKYSSILDVYNPTEIRALVEHEDIQSMTLNLNSFPRELYQD